MPVTHAGRSRESEPQPERLPITPHPSGPPQPWPAFGRGPEFSFADLVGGRVLAWVGGATTLLGVVFFLMLAISRGWIGIEARVVMAGLASAALGAAGVWLHDRRARTEASLTMVGAGAAGLFATWIVAGQVYAVVSTLHCRRRVVGRRHPDHVTGHPLAGPNHRRPRSARCADVADPRGSAQQRTHRGRARHRRGLRDGRRHQPGVELAWAGHGARERPAMAGLPSATGDDRAGGTLEATISGCLTTAAGYLALTRIAGQSTGELWLALVATVHLLVGLARVPALVIPAALRRVLVSLGVWPETPPLVSPPTACSSRPVGPRAELPLPGSSVGRWPKTTRTGSTGLCWAPVSAVTSL